MGHPRRPPRGGEGRRPCGRLRRRERHGGEAGARGGVCGIVHGRRRRGALGIDARQLRRVGPEHVGQHVREILEQVKAIGHLAGRGCPEACRFGVDLRAIPDEHLYPRMGLKLRCDSGDLPIGKEG
jgi:hypothetical protein